MIKGINDFGLVQWTPLRRQQQACDIGSATPQRQRLRNAASALRNGEQRCCNGRPCGLDPLAQRVLLVRLQKRNPSDLVEVKTNGVDIRVAVARRSWLARRIDGIRFFHGLPQLTRSHGAPPDPAKLARTRRNLRTDLMRR